MDPARDREEGSSCAPATSEPSTRLHGAQDSMVQQSSERSFQLRKSSHYRDVATAVRCLSETGPVYIVRAILDNGDDWKATTQRSVNVLVQYTPLGGPSCGDHLETSGVSPHENVARSLFRSMREMPGWMKAAVQEVDGRRMSGITANQDQLESARSGPAACWVLTGVEPFECSLADWMRDSIPGMPYFLAVDALLQFALDIASGVHHLLQHGVVHRDLKLYDVMWDSKWGPEGVGRAVLMDCQPIVRSIKPNGPVSAVDAADQEKPEAGPASGAGATMATDPASVTTTRTKVHSVGTDIAVEADDQVFTEYMAGAGRKDLASLERQAATVLGRVLQELLAEGMQLRPEFRKAAMHVPSCGQTSSAYASDVSSDASAMGPSQQTKQTNQKGDLKASPRLRQDAPPGAPAELQSIATALQGLLSPDPSSRIGVAGAVERLRMDQGKLYYGMNHILSGLVREDASSGGGELTDLFDEVRRDVESSSTLEGVHLLLRLANGVEILRWARSWDEDPRLAATDEAGEDGAQREGRQALIEVVERATSRDARHLKGMVLEGKHGPLIASLRNAMHGRSMLLNGGEACDVISELVAHVKGDMMCNLVLSQGLIQCAVDLLASSRCSDRERAAGLIAALCSVVHKPEQMVDACVQANTLPWLGCMLERNEFVHDEEAALAAKALLVIVQQVDTEGKRQVVQAGCLPGLALAVSRPGTPAFADSVNIVRRIANESEDLRRAVVQQDGMVAGIIDGFGRADPDSATEYIETLITLGSGNDEAMLSLVDAGGMDVVANAMRSNAGLVESTALRALSSLIDCENSPLRHTMHRHVLETDMLPNLAFTLTSTRGLDAFWAAKSLFHLSRGGDETKRRIVASGALPGIVQLLSSRRADEAELAARVLQQVPSTKEDWRELVDQTEVMPKLVGLLESNSDANASGYQAAKVLIWLSGQALDLLDVVIAADPFQPLVRMLSSSSPRAHAAVKVLAAMSGRGTGIYHQTWPASTKNKASVFKMREIPETIPGLVDLLGKSAQHADAVRVWETLASVLHDPDDHIQCRLQKQAVRAGIFDAVGRLLAKNRQDINFVGLTLNVVADVTYRNQSAAIPALNTIGADVLAAQLNSRVPPSVRFAAVNALSQIIGQGHLQLGSAGGAPLEVIVPILRTNVVSCVVALLQGELSRQVVRRDYIWLLLQVLAGSHDGMHQVVVAGAVPLFVRLLRIVFRSEYNPDYLTASFVAHTISRMLAGPNWAADAVLEQRPVEALVKMLDLVLKPNRYISVWRREFNAAATSAAEALSCAARLGNHLKRTIVDLGAIPLLTRMLNPSSYPDRDLGEVALGCLLELSSGPETVQLAIADAEVLEDLASVLKAMDPSGIGTIAQLASNLVARSEAVRRAVASSDLFEALVCALNKADIPDSRLLLQETVAVLSRDTTTMRSLGRMVPQLSQARILSQLQESVNAGSHLATELRDRLRSFEWQAGQDVVETGGTCAGSGNCD